MSEEPAKYGNEKTETVKKDPTDINAEAQKAMMDALKIKKAEIDETLSQVEKRNKEFKEMVDELKMSGRGSVRSQEISEDEKARQAARNLIKGSGFEDRMTL